MTVKELIAILQDQPEDKQVVVLRCQKEDWFHEDILDVYYSWTDAVILRIGNL
jgi:hypothetical protein